MAAKNEAVIKLSADPKAVISALDRVESRVQKMEAGFRKVAKVSGVAFAGLVATMGVTIKKFADFDNQLRGVRTLLDESSFGSQKLDDGFKQMTKDLKEVAKEFPVSIGGLNKALFDTVSAGVDADKAVQAVGVAAKLAVAGITDVSVATDGITSALNAYGLEAENAEVVAAKFFTAQKFGKTTVEELSKGFGLVASTAQNAGVSLDELLAAVSAATTAGIRTNQAYTSLQAIIANIAKPTADAADEAKRLGIQFDSTALRTLGLKGFLDKLTKAEGFNKTSAEKLFGSVEALKVAYALTGEQAEEFTNVLGELQDQEKSLMTFNEAFAVQNASLSNQYKVFKNQIQVLAINIGEVLAPAVAKVLTVLNDLMKFFLANEEAAKKLAWVLGIGAGAAGLTFAISSLGLLMPKLVAGFRAFNAVLPIATMGVRGLVGATGLGLLLITLPLIYKNLDLLRNFMMGPFFAAFAFVQEVVAGVIEKFKAMGQAVIAIVKRDWEGLKTATRTALTPLPTIVYNAGKKAGIAYSEGRKIGRILEDKRKAEEKEKENKHAGDIVDINAAKAVKLIDDEGFKNKQLEDEEARKNAEIIEQEMLFANDILAIDEDMANGQVGIYEQTTGQLVSAAQARRAAIIAAESSGGGSSSGTTSGGMSTTSDKKRAPGLELYLTDSPEGRAARKQLKAGLYNPFTGKHDLRDYIQRTLSRQGIQFREGFTGHFSGREIVIPEKFAEGIRRNKFSLIGPKTPGGSTSGQTKIVIDLKPQAAKFITVKQNENSKLGVSRAL